MAFTGATAGIAAGAQTNDTLLDWALEATYKTPPTGSYQQGRFTSETLSRTETTARPSEISALEEASQAVVTQIAASGRISGALSTGTFDDFFSGVLSADWLSRTITSSGDATKLPYIQWIAADNVDGVQGYKFVHFSDDSLIAGLPASGMVRLNDPANGIVNAIVRYEILPMRSGGIYVEDTPLASITADAVASAGATVEFDGITNAKVRKSYTIRKKILDKYLLYPGTPINQVQLTFTQGQFAQIEVDVAPANEILSDTDIAAAVLPAPAGVVHNTVDNFLGVTMLGVEPEGCVTAASITLARTGNKTDYGNGHADACGIVTGQFLASGSISLYFRTWDQYQAALSGTQGPVVIKTADSSGNGYAFVFLNAALRNPRLQTNAVNSTYELQLDIEGNPSASGGTFSIFRLTPPAS